MAKMIVATDGLRLRSSGEVKPGNILLKLPLAQEVEIIEAPKGQTFWQVRTEVEGETKIGFVSSKFLREPVGEARENLVAGAVRQWIRFDRGRGRENEAPFFQFVGEFWQDLGINLDGRDIGHPWSAAFISFIVRETGAYPDFKFHAAHAKYILDAKAKRLAGDASAPFWLFRLNEHKPQIGDLVCKWRIQKRTFDDLPSSGFRSHTDVVVEIRDDEVRTIGGNVGQSVSVTSFPLNTNGFLKEAKNAFAMMRNNR